MRPSLAASYSQVRETPSRVATSAGLRRSCVLICWLLTWVIDRERPKTDNDFGSAGSCCEDRGELRPRSRAAWIETQLADHRGHDRKISKASDAEADDEQRAEDGGNRRARTCTGDDHSLAAFV